MLCYLTLTTSDRSRHCPPASAAALPLVIVIARATPPESSTQLVLRALTGITFCVPQSQCHLHCIVSASYVIQCDPCLFKSCCGVITIILSPGYPCSKGGYKVILYFQSIHWYVSHIAVQSSAKSAKNKKETLSKIIIQDFPLIDIADNKTVEK